MPDVFDPVAFFVKLQFRKRSGGLNTPQVAEESVSKSLHCGSYP
jgi:hypothetical protein